MESFKIFFNKQTYLKHNPYLPHIQQSYVDDNDVADNYA